MVEGEGEMFPPNGHQTVIRGGWGGEQSPPRGERGGRRPPLCGGRGSESGVEEEAMMEMMTMTKILMDFTFKILTLMLVWKTSLHWYFLTSTVWE